MSQSAISVKTGYAGRPLLNLLGWAERMTAVEGRRARPTGVLKLQRCPQAPTAPCRWSATAVALHSCALLCSLLAGEPPCPHHLPGILGISADLQLILRADRLWSWTHYHFNWSASVFSWSLLEK